DLSSHNIMILLLFSFFFLSLSSFLLPFSFLLSFLRFLFLLFLFSFFFFFFSPFFVSLDFSPPLFFLYFCFWPLYCLLIGLSPYKGGVKPHSSLSPSLSNNWLFFLKFLSSTILFVPTLAIPHTKLYKKFGGIFHS